MTEQQTDYAVIERLNRIIADQANRANGSAGVERAAYADIEFLLALRDPAYPQRFDEMYEERIADLTDANARLRAVIAAAHDAAVAYNWTAVDAILRAEAE